MRIVERPEIVCISFYYIQNNGKHICPISIINSFEDAIRWYKLNNEFNENDNDIYVSYEGYTQKELNSLRLCS